MPKGIKRSALELAAHDSTKRVFAARRRYDRARRELDAAIADEAVAVERVRFAEVLKGARA